MSELIQKHDNRATIRWKLLTGVSAMALTAYVASSSLARAEDGDRPQLWIELGGQMDVMSGLTAPVTAPFMFVTPTPEVYNNGSLTELQRPSRFAFGAEGKITFQPRDSDWSFSASVRYGRANSERRIHHQTTGVKGYFPTLFGAIGTRYTKFILTEAFLDNKTQSREHHMVLDFSVGKDVGIGLFGRDGSSTINAGVRDLNITQGATATIYARPEVRAIYLPPKYQIPGAAFTGYTFNAHTVRSFNGIGPALSWNASAALAGNEQDGELRLDWGINAAMLFGRQKAKVNHATTATKFHGLYYIGSLYPARSYNGTRTRKVTVPNIGGSAGLSLKWVNAKVSVGYRYDTFLKAMDTGMDARKTSNLTFNGPYASISIGLGD